MAHKDGGGFLAGEELDDLYLLLDGGSLDDDADVNVNILPSKFDDIISTNILMTEVANHILIHLSGINTATNNPPEVISSITDKEMKCLQYRRPSNKLYYLQKTCFEIIALKDL